MHNFEGNNTEEYNMCLETEMEKWNKVQKVKSDLSWLSLLAATLHTAGLHGPTIIHK